MREAVGVFGLPFKMEGIPSMSPEASRFTKAFESVYWAADPVSAGKPSPS